MSVEFDLPWTVDYKIVVFKFPQFLVKPVQIFEEVSEDEERRSKQAKYILEVGNHPTNIVRMSE